MGSAGFSAHGLTILRCWLSWLSVFLQVRVVFMLQERGPLPGPETGLLSNTQKWIVEIDTCADKARDLLGKGTQVESGSIRVPRRTALPCGSQSWVSWWWDYFPGGWILGSGGTRGFSFWPFSNASGWWWLISSVFLIRISCLKTTHANGY